MPHRRDALNVAVRESARRMRELWQFRDGVVPHRDVYFETFFMAGVLSSQSYLQMKTLSAALEQSEEIMQWINVISARRVSRRPVTFRPPYAIDATRIHQTRSGVVEISNLSRFGPRRGRVPSATGEI